MKTKRNFLAVILVALATLIPGTANAQTEMPKNEIGIGYGWNSVFGILTTFEHDLLSMGKINVESQSGAISLNYMRNLNRTFAIGLTGVYEHTKGMLKDKKSDSSEGVMAEKTDYITVMPTIRAYWSNHSSFGYYSKIAAGVSFESSKAQTNDVKDLNKTYFAFQITPIGLEFGSPTVRGFGELGIGMQGFVNVGVRFGF